MTADLATLTGSVLVAPPRHCELRTCTLRVASAAPFGLLWWYRDLEVPLARPVLVAPRLARPDPEQLRLSPDGATLFVANENDALLTAIDVASRKAISETPVGVEPEGVADYFLV